MTAEICVMNKIGIALAADSAVSIGENRYQKIFNSANKLFSLNNSIGIMIYGNSDFHDLPWETIIKVFKDYSLDQSFETLEDASDYFFEFLSNQTDFFDVSAEYRFIFSTIRSYIEKILEDEFSELIISNPNTNINDESGRYKTLFEDYLKAERKKLNKLETIIPDHSLYKKFRNDYDPIVKKHLSNTLFFEFDDNTLNLLMNCCYLLMIKEPIAPQFQTGIVFAGFGRKDLFPKLFEFVVGGSFYENIKVIEKPSIQIGNKKGSPTAAIRPFAQKEMVFTFMNGIDEYFLEEIPYILHMKINEKFDDFISKNIESILDKATIQEIKRGFINEIIDDLESYFSETTYENYRYPILQVLDTLPKEELASMAETLVNLTSFKRKVSLDVENVGGPIDVALITKGDGFVWIKRKHYFDKELNHEFFARKNIQKN